MENVIRCIFTSVVMLPNFIHFRPKIGFKNTLESSYFTQRPFERSLKRLVSKKIDTRNQPTFSIHHIPSMEPLMICSFLLRRRKPYFNFSVHPLVLVFVFTFGCCKIYNHLLCQSPYSRDANHYGIY